MKNVHKFIREFNLKYSRKFKRIPSEEFGKRFVIDSNAHLITFETEVTCEDRWVLYIAKNHGKYFVSIMRIDWNDMQSEKSFVTSRDDVVIRLINNEIEYSNNYCVENKRRENLHWQVVRTPSELYDREEEIDFGDLPDEFRRIDEDENPFKVPEGNEERRAYYLSKFRRSNELESVPEFLDINL